MKNIILTAILLMFSFFKVSAQEVKAKALVNPVAFESQIANKKVQLIDVRTPKEYKEGTILNAINIDFLDESFLKKLEQLDKKQPVYIFCQSGKRSAAAAEKMQEAGFDVVELAGGYKAWKAEKD
ncbi:rhodanese-like domain-containing protein [Myroides odoratus]|uniref:rhodanese-like domain-containing protein n=1 Tax=Myroides odoratus TaxID=256 RepID=UPI00076580C6|nr:rhodanese-like domain-containing protein [Myroides odoratus]